ncbi:MAG: hydroxymethylglutaryl-CoA reductase, degradative [Polyangiaceae bacterium]|nr:hydroxymethylglutaryl-CoA reductase, degradative [Polyangiaceae bacterium]MCW5791676.1 hydroxymethylglutaryl-CoA reductase, degradative [Polyangiaceae bacterium]
MSDGSRIPGFYKLSIEERRRRVSEAAGVDVEALTAALTGGLDPRAADKVVENVLGVYALPFGVALNVQVNGVDRLVPMVVEEPSVVAAASNAARMVRASGGFHATTTADLMISQVQLYDVPDPEAARERLLAHQAELLSLADAAAPGLRSRGGGPRDLEVRDLGDGYLVLHLLVDCQDAMGANLVNGMAEAVGPRAQAIAGGQLGLRILSNLCDQRRVKVRCEVHPRDLELRRGDQVVSGDEVLDGIVQASRFAERDPYRAATHNKGIMNGVDAVVLATGNDFRAVEAGAHAYAARSGRYAPLAVWRREGERLLGELELPLALGIVGGTLRVHPLARLALELTRVTSAAELAHVAASAGLASNLAALRALATEGIQRGHMSLHARSVATAAGAEGNEVELVAQRIAEAGHINLEQAELALAALRRAP